MSLQVLGVNTVNLVYNQIVKLGESCSFSTIHIQSFIPNKFKVSLSGPRSIAETKMSLYTTFTALWIVFLLLAIIVSFSLLFFLRKLTIEWVHPEGFKLSKHWWRFLVPTVVAVFLASFQDLGMNNVFHVGYILLLGLLVPFGVAFYLLRESLEKKWERIMVLIAMLLLLNATFFSTHWYYHYRNNHSDGYDDGENPHLSERNWFLIPLWVVTIICSIASVVMWRKEGRKANEQLLPSNEQPSMA